MELVKTTVSSVSIVTEHNVLTYTYSGSAPIEIVARVNVDNITGNGSYNCHIYLNGSLITPAIAIPVGAGITHTVFVSRSIPLETSDIVTVGVIGTGSDTSVNVTTSLRDVTPVELSQIPGLGNIVVDHNYGGSNVLSYETSGSVGISGATILIYNSTDYDAGNNGSQFVVARSSTNSLGHWVTPVLLFPGSYTLIYFKPGAFGPDVRVITVTS